MITDEEFQNRGDTLRLAPWLDMPKLRARLRSVLRNECDDRGFFDGYNSDYIEDVMDFCEGNRTRIPRSLQVLEYISNIIATLFPKASEDRIYPRAVDHILSHIVQQKPWSYSHRGAQPEGTPAEEMPPPYPFPEPEDDDDDDEDEEYHYNDDQPF